VNTCRHVPFAKRLFMKSDRLTAIDKKTPGLSPPANYTDRATATCRQN
jgi:hypothetical protein